MTRMKLKLLVPALAATALYLSCSTTPVLAAPAESAHAVPVPAPDPQMKSWVGDKVGGWLVGKAMEYLWGASGDLGCQKDLDAMTSVVSPPGSDLIPADALD